MKSVLIVGSGRSGRGMLGELYNKDGFHITYADINSELIKGLREQKYHTVQMKNIKTSQITERTVHNFDCIDVINEADRYIELLATTKYVSSALMPDAFEHFASSIKKAYDYRIVYNLDTPIYITIGANYVYLREKYYELLEKIGLTKKQLNDNNMYLILSIVNRKNLLPEASEQTSDKYRVVGDDKSVLRVDNFVILKNELDVPSFFRFEDNLDGAMAVKIWTGNVVQCSMAFVALSKGYEFTDQAANDKQCSNYAYQASIEAYEAVKREFNLPDRTIEDAKYTVTLFRSETFRDSLYRITREPIRKFTKNDRFIGPALCCLKHGILPYYITRCLAYGFLYKNELEPQTIEVEHYIENNGIEKAVYHYCQLNNEIENERLLAELIIKHYLDISKDDLLEGD